MPAKFFLIPLFQSSIKKIGIKIKYEILINEDKVKVKKNPIMRDLHLPSKKE